jgi:hypothetical protein
MKILSITSAVILAVLPNMVYAGGCGKGHSDSASIGCPVGQAWDTESKSCQVSQSS